MILKLIKFRSDLTEAGVLKKEREREPGFEAVPGFLQKYYIKTDDHGGSGGVYLWDSHESLDSYRKSNLAAGIAGADQTVEAPSIVFSMSFFNCEN